MAGSVWIRDIHSDSRGPPRGIWAMEGVERELGTLGGCTFKDINSTYGFPRVGREI